MDERARPRLVNPYESSTDSTELKPTDVGTIAARPAPHLGGAGEPNAAGLDANQLNERARSWLHINCAHCHREGAGGAVVSHFDYESKVPEMKAMGRIPSQGAFGLVGAHVLTPGDPESSVVYFRILTTGQGRMPHLGSRLVDVPGARVIHDWIRHLPKEWSEDQAENAAADQLRIENAGAAQRVRSAALDDPAPIDRLLSSVNGALALVSTLDQRAGRAAEAVADQAASHPVSSVRDLFERFLPEEKRPKKLGSMIKPEAILALSGDAARGRQLFFQEGVQCSRCHRIQGEGTDFGPDLSRIGQKYSPPQILENILFPSKTIEPNFISYSIETKDDLAHSGFIVRRTAEEIVLKDATTQGIPIPLGKVKVLRVQSISVMPELLLQALTAQNVADLLAYLSRLR